MSNFNFTNDLIHQNKAVESVLELFSTNDLKANVKRVQENNNIKNQNFKDDNIYDICMQTGTGKTYTYTKTMFMLNNAYNYDSFIVLVPTLAIKSGTKNFFELSRQHFIDEFGKSLSFYEVKSEKSNKKGQMPQSIKDFCKHDDKNSIRVLLINAGMLNSDTFKNDYESNLFDEFFNIFDALAHTKSVLIIDEPHKFAKENSTWQNILKLKARFILRYGATFKEYSNLLYNLTPLQAFNDNLVKGVRAFVQDFKIGQKAYIKLKDLNKNEPIFCDDKNNQFSLKKGQNFSCFYDFLNELFVEDFNTKRMLLSNGVELSKNDKFNPFSFNDDLAKQMINACLNEHFKLEKDFLSKKVKIKPLSLFFIDDISSYRGENARLKEYFEKALKAKIEEELKHCDEGFYKEYLKKSLEDISLTHGGYFSKDNSDKDEKIEQEINEILHDKIKLLSLDNIRRFIFCKWTLKEGWDNPNVFNICKLRNSASEISKLQEVGRGLRLPVDEHKNRLNDDGFYLNYFVDASESDFIKKLISEIEIQENENELKLGDILDEKFYKLILSEYNLNEDIIYDELFKCEAINKRSVIINIEKLQEKYPLAFNKNHLKKDKVKNAKDKEKKVKIKKHLYKDIKILWEEINKKVFLKYSANEDVFLANFKNFLKEYQENLQENKSYLTSTSISVKEGKIQAKTSVENNYCTIKMLNYKEFLLNLSAKLGLNANTLHKAFYELLKEESFNVNEYLNELSLNQLCKEFNLYLLNNSNKIFTISYEEFSSTIHPTKITDNKGSILDEIKASDVGVLSDKEASNESFLYEEIFYDSNIESENIKANIKEVCVYMKIPKNSLKIPVAGGFTYSPDFAYVLKDNLGKVHYFVLESKGVDSKLNLRNDENEKINHAASLFKGLKISFIKQLKNNEIKKIVQQVLDA
ncbi:type III restriction-modification system endonuclease [Campylobacter canadensis]|uniref:type III restriction-modification system endonuclease n=1 Tax=Campylobacter canadensis TaxID=449520 RepID=UPI001CC9EAB6|nr:type III restriction-modification system endonuclease [Campylobacter canadensis]MBZ8003924.1 type III restriction-modification system endonuclease [Campylobacter canadensis]